MLAVAAVRSTLLAASFLVLALGVNGCGRLLGRKADSTKWSIGGLPAAGDLDGDGFEEIVGFGKDGVTCLDGKTLKPVWAVPLPAAVQGTELGSTFHLFIRDRKLFGVFEHGLGAFDGTGHLVKIWPATTDRLAESCSVGSTLWLTQLDQVVFGVDLKTGQRQAGPVPKDCTSKTLTYAPREAPAVYVDGPRKNGLHYRDRYISRSGSSVRIAIREPGTPEIHVVAEGPGETERFHTVVERGQGIPPDNVDVVGNVVHVHSTYSHYGVDLATGKVLYKVTEGMEWRASATRLFILRQGVRRSYELKVFDARTGAPILPAVPADS